MFQEMQGLFLSHHLNQKPEEKRGSGEGERERGERERGRREERERRKERERIWKMRLDNLQ